MKNVMKKQALALLAVVLSFSIAAGAVADTIYVTSGFVIPAVKIGGNRPVEEKNVEEDPAELPEEVPQAVDPNVPAPEEVPQGTDSYAEEKALDVDVAGLSVVDGEDENEDKNSDTENINIAENTQSVTFDDAESVVEPDETLPEDAPADEIGTELGEVDPVETENLPAEIPEEDNTQYSEEKIKTDNEKPAADIVVFEIVDLDGDDEPDAEQSEQPADETIAPAADETIPEETKDDEPTVEATEETPEDPSDENNGEPDELFPDNMIQIRTDADGMSEITAEVPIDSELQIFERDGDWFLVLCGDVAGYVHITQMPNAESLMDEEEKTVRKVNIFTSRKTMVTEGEAIHLTSMIQGFDDCIVIEYQWQYDRGNGWEDVPDATEPTYTYTADAVTLKYNWRLKVHWETAD